MFIFFNVFTFLWTFIYVKTHRTLNANWQSVVAVLIIKIYYCSCAFEVHCLPSTVLTCAHQLLQCFDAVGLGGRKGIRPVKKLSGGGAGVVICLELGADAYCPADATATHCLLLQ